MTIEKSSTKHMRMVLGFLLGTAVFLSAGCSNNDGERAGDKESVVNVTQASKEAQVKKRVLARWKALIDADWEGAYAYFSPGSRELQSFEAFKSHMQVAPIRRLEAKIKEIGCKEDVCDVKLDLDYIYLGLVEAMRGQRSSSLVQEKWIYLDGNWWYSGISQP